MAYTYSNLYNVPCVGLRFFTVYGPWGRPDMAYFKFTKNIINDVPIEVYGNGEMSRDFTYIDDIVHGILELVNIDNKKLFTDNVPFEILNLGNDSPVELNEFISIIEKNIGKKAIKQILEIQPGDVKRTSANLRKIQAKIKFFPKTKIETGLPKFIKWFNSYYELS